MTRRWHPDILRRMKTRRGYLFALFLVFSYLGGKRLFSPDGSFPPSPVDGTVILALFIVALAALFGAWRAHRRLEGHPATTTGLEAAVEALVQLGLALVFSALAIWVGAGILVVGIDQTLLQVSPLILLAILILGLAVFFLVKAVRALGRAFGKWGV